MRTSRLLLLSVNALAILLADALSASQSRTDLKRFGEPQSRKVVGYEEASCLDVTSEIQVCKADSSPEPNDLLLLARGELVRKWGDRSGMHRGMILDVFLADLDADSRPELVIADRLAASNGMAMTRDEVFIVSRFESLDRSVVRFTAAEYHGGMFVRRAGRSGRWILATDWEGSSVLDPRRGRGTYLVGRWFRFANGRLVREPGVLVRRLLDSFALERAGMGPTAPYGWFLNGKGRSVEIRFSLLSSLRTSLWSLPPSGAVSTTSPSASSEPSCQR